MPIIEWIPVEAVKPNARNARTHSKKQIRQIADSIATFGFLVPILVDERRVVIAGHGRYAAAKLLGHKKVPAIEVQVLSEAKRRALALADNKIAENAGWDRELLAAELPELAAGGGESRHRDHRLCPGRDARAADDLACLMGGSQAAPYNVRVCDIVGRGRVKHSEFAMASGELARADFVEFLKRTLAAAAAVSRDGAVHFVCMDWRHIGELLEAGGAVYGDVLNLAVWVKSNAGQGSFYRSQHELVGVFRVGREPHLNNVELGRHGRSRSNVWHYAGGQHLSGGPPRRTSVASDGQAGRVGCRCHEGLHPSRRHRARHVLRVRDDNPGGRARGSAGLCTGD